MDNPLVSIAIIAYNSSNTICETLDSVIAQDYDNLEVIVFDDCSTDDTVEKVKAWESTKPESLLRRINFDINVNNENLGVTKNCNVALKKTNGKYIDILAADDLLFPYSTSERVKFAEENELPVVFSKVEIFGDDNSWLQIQQIEKSAASYYQMLKMDTHIQYLKLLEQNYILAPGAAFVNRQFLLGIGGYDERFPMIEDWPFFLKYMQNNYPVKFCDKTLVRYRVSRNSLSHAAPPSYLKSCYDFFILVRRDGLISNGKQTLADRQEKQFKNAKENFLCKDKYQVDYYQLLQWVRLKQNNIQLIDFFHMNNFRNIAIYGMGDMAYLLINELKDTDVTIRYGIDANFYGDFWGIHVISIEEEFSKVDAIIITPVFAYDNVFVKLHNKCEMPLISLEDVLFCK